MYIYIYIDIYIYIYTHIATKRTRLYTHHHQWHTCHTITPYDIIYFINITLTQQTKTTIDRP